MNVTICCYRHVLRILCYYMYSGMCNLTEQVSHFDSVDRQKGNHKPLTTETRVRARVCPVSYHTSFACTLGYTERSYTVSNCQCTLYTVHGITTVLLNYTITGKFGMNLVAWVIIIIPLYTKILCNKYYCIIYWHCLDIVHCTVWDDSTCINDFHLSQTFVGNVPCNCGDLFSNGDAKRH